MNIQEAIEEIKNLEGLTILDKTINFDSEMIPKKEVFNIINQIDEPEKPVVPQFVADWYEDYKGDLEFNIYNLCIEYRDNGQGVNKDLKEWFGNDSRTKPIETLMKMKFFGYEVEKEKLYTVSLKRNGIGIGVQQDGSFKERFAKEELSEYGFDNLDEYEVKEVDE